MDVQTNLQTIEQRVEQACQLAGRKKDEVKIIAVTKYVTVERAKEALAAGITHLGENRDDPFLTKYESIKNDATWHFIGTLQTRKVKNIIDQVDYIHSLDRISLAEEINKRANKKIKCLVQVNVSNEATKHGLKKEEVLSFIHKCEPYKMIEIVGLMTMAPLVEDQEIIKHTFAGLKSLQEEIKQLQLPYAPCTELSMGMSNDFEIAILEGATMIRIGTALVG